MTSRSEVLSMLAEMEGLRGALAEVRSDLKQTTDKLIEAQAEIGRLKAEAGRAVSDVIGEALNSDDGVYCP